MYPRRSWWLSVGGGGKKSRQHARLELGVEDPWLGGGGSVETVGTVVSDAAGDMEGASGGACERR